MVRYMLDDSPKWIFIALWIAGNGALFAHTFWAYCKWENYQYLYSIVGISVAFSRASASALNLNLALILLPVCRNFLTVLRRSFQCSKQRSVCRQLDRNIEFHKLCGYTICFWTVIHYLNHTFNFERFVEAADHSRVTDDIDYHLKYKLSSLPTNHTNGTWLNPVRSVGLHPIYVVVTSLPGSTGIIATIMLVAMVSTSTDYIRRHYFEVFWFTHHLFILFFIIIVFHGFGGVIRYLSNPLHHSVTLCRDNFTNWNKEINGEISCPDPQFAPKQPETWMWVIGPVILYIIERGVRFYRRFQRCLVIKIIRHPSNVLELQLYKRGFSMISGQYIIINCPQASLMQWHPFTLTSAPDEDFFSVHIRIVGDWTGKVSRLCDKAKGNPAALPTFAVDGPFGTCSEDVFDYEAAMLVGAGIGVTPFASILKHIWYMHVNGNQTYLKNVHFVWICPDTQAFSWFVDLLKSLEEKVQASDNPTFLDIQIYWTRGWTQLQANELIESVSEEVDIITGLRHKTHFGRPDWSWIFSHLKNSYSRKKVGVFFCGPAAVAKELHSKSHEFSSIDPFGTQFVFNKENF